MQRVRETNRQTDTHTRQSGLVCWWFYEARKLYVGSVCLSRGYLGYGPRTALSHTGAERAKQWTEKCLDILFCFPIT